MLRKIKPKPIKKENIRVA